MGGLANVLLGCYFSSLLAFSFVTHPVGYCFLLLFGAFSISGYVYLVLGFSWYLALFCLVYIGGVYVLFIFVSLHNPNPIQSFGGGFELVFFLFLFLEVLFFRSGVFFSRLFMSDYSQYLCTFFEGFSYCFFCLILMLGFGVISVVCGGKDSFFR